MKKNLKKRVITSFLLLLLLAISFVNNYILAYVLLVAGTYSLLEFFGMIKIIQKKSKLNQLIINMFFIIYILIFCIFFLNFSSSLYLKLLIYIILITCIASDIGGFTIGKLFKGPKLSKISPNKTVSGAVGSLIFSCIILSSIFFYFSKNFDSLIILVGLITSISCQLGDLFFSYLKRRSKLKDTGRFLPGHGGVLDRIDGILLGIPIGFLSLLIIY